jgi:NYN domain
MTHNGRIAIFADVSSLWFTAKRFSQQRVDYRRLLARIAEDRLVTTAVAFLTDRGSQDGFKRALMHMGYDTVMVPFGTAVDGELIKRALAASGACDTVAIAAGEGRYTELFGLLETNNVATEVYRFPVDCPMAEIWRRAGKQVYLDIDVLESPAASSG